jgi:hypothetical protein
MSIRFTDTQLVLLSAATQREDRCLVASLTLKGGAAQKVASKHQAQNSSFFVRHNFILQWETPGLAVPHVRFSGG